MAPWQSGKEQEFPGGSDKCGCISYLCNPLARRLWAHSSPLQGAGSSYVEGRGRSQPLPYRLAARVTAHIHGALTQQPLPRGDPSTAPDVDAGNWDAVGSWNEEKGSKTLKWGQKVTAGTGRGASQEG